MLLRLAVQKKNASILIKNIRKSRLGLQLFTGHPTRHEDTSINVSTTILLFQQVLYLYVQDNYFLPRFLAFQPSYACFPYYLLYLPPINGSRLRREVAAYLINLSAICCIFPGIAHILYLLQGFLSRTITLEFKDVDIVLGLYHTIYPTFALLL